jgi:hypothetical protein
VAVADYGGDSGKGGEFLGGALGIAARRNNAGCGVVAVSAADPGARFAIGFGGHAAGIHDEYVGSGRESLAGAGISKESGYGFPVRAGGATAEVLDVEGGGHRVSLANSDMKTEFGVSHPTGPQRGSVGWGTRYQDGQRSIPEDAG